MPPEVEEHVKRELARLERMPEASGEYSMARTYLEWLTEAAAWSVETEKPVDIAEARRISMQTITACEKSNGASSNIWRSISLIRGAAVRSCVSSVRPASGRPHWGRASPGRPAANSFE